MIETGLLYVPVFSFPMMSQMSFSVLWPATSSNVYCLGAMMLRVRRVRVSVTCTWQGGEGRRESVRWEDILEEGVSFPCLCWQGEGGKRDG